MAQNIMPYIKIARVDHWFKNLFMLPGTGLAIILSSEQTNSHITSTFIAFLSLCLLASANYVINEWLDARYDSFHPVKKNRPAANGEVQGKFVLIQYFTLLTFGLALAWQLSQDYLFISLIFTLMGVIYNVPPLRSKDRAYLDVLSESLNNPLRLLLGWSAIITGSMPPSSIVLAYWMGGAFLMSVKRFAEYRFIDNPEQAASYRRSFSVYTADSLLLSSFFYAICASFFLAVFLIKYRIEFLLTFPLFAILFTWYMALGMRHNSPAQNPEKLIKEKFFISYVILLIVAVASLYFINIPELNVLLTRLHYNS